MDTGTTTFILFLASFGGLMFLIAIVILCIILVRFTNVPLSIVATGMFWLGILSSIIFTSVAKSNPPAATLKAIVITQGTVNSILVVVLGFMAYNYIDNLSDRRRYIMLMLPVTLLLSIVSATTNAMQKLAG
jgi:hypothetical protein